MADYTVGFGKPPPSGRFKRGVSGNPKGRPKRELSPLADIVRDALHREVQFRERGKAKTSPAYAMGLKVLVDQAVRGDLRACALVLNVLRESERLGPSLANPIIVEDWLPDDPGFGKALGRVVASAADGANDVAGEAPLRNGLQRNE